MVAGRGGLAGPFPYTSMGISMAADRLGPRPPLGHTIRSNRPMARRGWNEGRLAALPPGDQAGVVLLDLVQQGAAGDLSAGGGHGHLLF